MRLQKGESDMLKGIDVSYCETKVDWNAVKSSGLADFVIIRAGYGKLASQKDFMFESHYAGAKKAGIPVGAYWYSYAKSVSEMQTEAKVFLQTIAGKQFEYPVYLDFEEKSQFALGRAKCSEMAKAFLDILENAGYYAGLYCSTSYLKNYFTDEIKNRYTIWLAHYGVAKPTYPGTYDIWQYSSSGSVPGINRKCDMNYCYQEDFPEIIKSAGLNGFPKPDNPAPLKSVAELAQEVLENKWGTGADRKARLTAAGYDYAAVQKAVNEILKQNEQSVPEPIETPEKETIQVTAVKDGKTFSGTLTEQ